MSIKSLYPTTRPSLYFNFRNPEKLDMKLEHYREDTPGLVGNGDSSATYVDKNGIIRYSALHHPRIDHDPLTKEPRGLLFEEYRQNFLHNSNMTSGWGVGTAGDTFTQSSGDQKDFNPDGSDAYHYSPSSNSGHHRYNKSFTVPTLGANYYVSVFVKRVAKGSVSNLNRYIELEVTGQFTGNTSALSGGGNGGSAITFDMETLTIQSKTENTAGFVGDAKIEDYGNGWYRLSYKFNPGTGSYSTGTVWWGHPTTLGGDTGGETGNGNPSFYLWGAMVEKGEFLTSHIHNHGAATSTRQNTTVRSLTDQEYGRTPCTIVMTYKLNVVQQWNRLFGLGDAGSDIRPFVNSGGDITFYNYGTNSPVYTPPAGNLGLHRVAFGIKQDATNALYVNGTLLATQSNSSPTTPQVFRDLQLGHSSTGTSPRVLNGYILDWALYSGVTHSDNQLKELSRL